MAEGQRQRIIIPPPVPGTPEYYSYKRQNRELLPAEKRLGMIRDPNYKYVYRSDNKKSIGIASIIYLLCFLFLLLLMSCFTLSEPQKPLVIELAFGNPDSQILESVDIELSGVDNDLPTDEIGDTEEAELEIEQSENKPTMQQVSNEPVIEQESAFENSFDNYLESISSTPAPIDTNNVQSVSANASENVESLSSAIGQAVSSNNAMASRHGSGDGMNARLAKAGAQTGDVQVSLFWNTFDDVDLHVYYTPGNGLSDNINWTNRFGRLSSGILDVDMNAHGPQNSQCVENVFWPTGTNPRGFFVVQAHLFRSWSGMRSVPVTIRVKIGPIVETFDGMVYLGASPITITKFRY